MVLAEVPYEIVRNEADCSTTNVSHIPQVGSFRNPVRVRQQQGPLRESDLLGSRTAPKLPDDAVTRCQARLPVLEDPQTGVSNSGIRQDSTGPVDPGQTDSCAPACSRSS